MSKKVNLVASANGGLYEIFGVDTDQDMTDWQAVGYVYDPADPFVALQSITLTIDTTNNKITLKMTPTAAKTLLGSDTQKNLSYALLVKPTGLSYGVRFFYGPFDVVAGGPLWA